MGKPSWQQCHRRHSSRGHLSTQATPLRQGKDTTEGKNSVLELKLFQQTKEHGNGSYKHHFYHQCFLPKEDLPPQTQELRLQFYQGWIGAVASRCFPLSLSLFSIWTDLKRSENIPGTPAWRWGQWIWLTGPSGFHRNSPQILLVPSGFLTRSEIRKSQSAFASTININNLIIEIVLFSKNMRNWSSKLRANKN